MHDRFKATAGNLLETNRTSDTYTPIFKLHCVDDALSSI